MIIHRAIQSQIESNLFKGKVIVLYGARQVGKTTLVRQIASKQGGSSYFNCDEPDIRAALTGKTSTALVNFLGKNRLVILDEAQRVENIGLTLKLIVDTYPEIQIIATGSSSFDLAGKVSEPLTGRKIVYHLFPISINELLTINSRIEIDRLLNDRLIYGMYPEIITGAGKPELLLREITNSYLYKDLFTFNEVRNPEVLWQLLQALALQIGNEVSYNELGSLVGLDKKTIMKYLQVLEAAFVIFRLPPFHNNPRKELGRKRKVYFCDNGIRNALINNLNPIGLRNDVGALWENFMISERLKKNSQVMETAGMFFWRGVQQGEVDYIEVSSGKVSAFEMKWGRKTRVTPPASFRALYPGVPFEVIHPGNYWHFVK
jgi:predicted AAA+ superfamily ATPase